MARLTYLSAGRTEWQEEQPVGLSSPHAAVVRPLAVSTCDMDAAALSGLVRFRGPVPLGHEAVAKVLEVGDEVRTIAPGQHVVVPWQISCGRCARCRRGQDAYCQDVPAGACYGWGPHVQRFGGLLADAVDVPFADHMLTPLPRGLSPAEASGLGDNLVDAWRSVGPYVRPGSRVLVVGGVLPFGGSIGLYACAYAVALGAAEVVFVSHDELLCRQAERLGARSSHVTASYPDLGPEFDVTVDTSGLAEGLSLALRATGPCGTCTCTAGAVHRDPPAVPLYEMYLRSVTLRTGWVSTRPLIPRALAPIASGAVRPLDIATVVRWEEAPDALREPFTKLVVVR